MGGQASAATAYTATGPNDNFNIKQHNSNQIYSDMSHIEFNGA